MRTLRRFSFAALVVGIIGALAGVGHSDAAITPKACSTKPSPTPTSSAPVAQPTLTPPPPSSTDGPPSPDRTPGPNNCVPKDGDVVFGTQTLSFSVTNQSGTAPTPTRSVKLEIKAYKDSQAADATGSLFDKSYTRCGRADTDFDVPWDTVGDTPRNGHYQVVVTVGTYATACAGNGPTKTATWPSPIKTGILVDNAPDPVPAPRVIATTSSAISLQWDASNAPDVMRYEVYRAVTSSAKSKPAYKDFALWGVSTSTAFRDSQISPGAYWYAIVVTRRSVVTPDDGISSVMSLMSAPVTVAPPPKTSGGSGSNASGPTVKRYIPLNRLLLPQTDNGALAPVPDAPYSAQLPYGSGPEEGAGALSGPGGAKSGEAGAMDPRGPVLPVAVGAFLVSAALALGRMPY